MSTIINAVGSKLPGQLLGRNHNTEADKFGSANGHLAEVVELGSHTKSEMLRLRPVA